MMRSVTVAVSSIWRTSKTAGSPDTGVEFKVGEIELSRPLGKDVLKGGDNPLGGVVMAVADPELGWLFAFSTDASAMITSEESADRGTLLVLSLLDDGGSTRSILLLPLPADL
jgi:hypothetical protein